MQKIGLLEFVNTRPELKSGKVEILGAFIWWMENVKKVTFASEIDFEEYFENFKKQ